MGIDHMSASQVSRMCSSLDESVADLQERDLSDVSYPYIWLDATYIKRRDAGRVQSTALVTAIDTETYDGWKSFLLSLRARGIDGVICVTSDAHEGLKRAIQEVFPGAARQRCIVHLMRNAAGNDQAEEGRRVGHPEGRVRRARHQARARAVPAGHRADRGLLPQGSRSSGHVCGRSARA